MNRKALVPGSFDPPTLGHMDVIERASALFDDVVVCVGRNSAKSPFFSVDDRLKALTHCCEHLANVRIDSFDGLLVNFAKQVGATAVVRGLRATSDFDYEFQTAMANRRMYPELETIFLMTKWEHSYLSSSIVREVATFGGDYSGFVEPFVAELIARRLKSQ